MRAKSRRLAEREDFEEGFVDALRGVTCIPKSVGYVRGHLEGKKLADEARERGIEPLSPMP
jgi:hypothetical protein